MSDRWQQSDWIENMKLRIDWSFLTEERLGRGKGIPDADVDRLQDRVNSIHADILRRRDEGKLGFMEIVRGDGIVKDALSTAEALRGRFDDVLVLGIGGSSLGTIALLQSLCRPFHNLLPPAERGFPRLFVADNIDPVAFSDLLDLLDWNRTLVLVISKSGTTAETMSQFLIVRDILIKKLGVEEARKHIIAITDPAKGYLRTIADREGYQALSVPPNVGGRFSVLTAVGLLPAALAGIDIAELVAGAANMEERCRNADLNENPAYRNGVYHFLAHRDLGLNIQVYWAYANGLYGLADWMRQLVAESLGKRFNLEGNEVCVGPTPVKALGPTDQHSQLQLYMEGPRDKIITILAVERFRNDLKIPPAFEDLDGVGYLGGHSMQELLHAEQEATTLALGEAGRPNLMVTFPEVNAFTMGQAIFLYELQTAFMGALYEVDPLDQPGVEQGKKLTYAMMGRKGFEEFRNKVEELRKRR